MKYVFTNILGSFVLDDGLKIIGKAKEEGKLKLKPVPKDKINETLANFKDKKYYQEFYQKNIQLTKKAIKDSVNEDNLIMQTISNITELDKTTNLLTKRLREWYSLYHPELSKKIARPELFVEQVLKEKKSKESMGAELSKLDLEEINLLAKNIQQLSSLRENHEKYLEKIMKRYCPNLLELAGVTIGAKLLELGKGLKKLAVLPASTIQLLGAEKALFRHLKTGARSPKYGVIHDHQLIQKAKRDLRGKAARRLADKLSLCARLDFFQGEFKAKEYRKELEEKLK